MAKTLWLVVAYQFYKGGSRHVDEFKAKDFKKLKATGKIKVSRVLRRYYA